jgi:hypothetical protein
MVALFAVANAASADEKQPAGAAQLETKVIELTIHPAAVPRPALRYPLLPTYLDKTDLNAAPMYYKSLVLLNGGEGVKPTKEDWEKVIQWLEMPLAKFPEDEARKLLKRFGGVFKQVDIAARRAYCDWDTEIPESKENLIAILLPELSSLRSLGRLVALRARADIAAGDYTRAIHSLQTGYAMSRHIAEQPFLISALVGIAVGRLMNEQLVAMASRKGAPNLYWALTALPRPLVSLQKSLELEAQTVHLSFPQLAAAKTDDGTSSDADLARLLKKFQLFASLVGGDSGDSQNVMADFFGNVVIASKIGMAKKELVDRGYSEKEVDAMPPSRIVLLYSALTFDELRDEMFKWFNVPYWQARDGIGQAASALNKQGRLREIIPLARTLLPAIAGVKTAEARMQRHIDLLRVIEAVRLFASDHDGKLPAALSDIKAVPIPNSPITGKAFDYRVENGVGILGSAEPDKQFPLRYRLKLAMPK